MNKQDQLRNDLKNHPLMRGIPPEERIRLTQDDPNQGFVRPSVWRKVLATHSIPPRCGLQLAFYVCLVLRARPWDRAAPEEKRASARRITEPLQSVTGQLFPAVHGTQRPILRQIAEGNGLSMEELCLPAELSYKRVARRYSLIVLKHMQDQFIRNGFSASQIVGELSSPPENAAGLLYHRDPEVRAEVQRHLIEGYDFRQPFPALVNEAPPGTEALTRYRLESAFLGDAEARFLRELPEAFEERVHYAEAYERCIATMQEKYDVLGAFLDAEFACHLAIGKDSVALLNLKDELSRLRELRDVRFLVKNFPNARARGYRTHILPELEKMVGYHQAQLVRIRETVFDREAALARSREHREDFSRLLAMAANLVAND